MNSKQSSIAGSEGRTKTLAEPCNQLTKKQTGTLIVNADDWGRDCETTDRTLDCVRCGSVSSVSAMVFMEDSERAAMIARDNAVDAGLHLNFTTQFSASGTPSQLGEHQRLLSQYLLRRRLSQTIFHPGLARSFSYVVAAQREEFARLYGREPQHVDGHHHMHLCANVLFSGLLPSGTSVRRNFSFQPGEKSFGNRAYRRTIDWILARRHQLTDLFFSIQPLEPFSRLQKIVDLSRKFVVELETHPAEPAEHKFLTGNGFRDLIGSNQVASSYSVVGG